jgi:2-polyprenyl-3-methyl-5-hydroxy-6-metoxy-1,4-benzoquinol methylase
MRSYQKELLDGDDLPFADVKRNMLELDLINQTLGGHKVTICGVEALSQNSKHKQSISIMEIGCGGGDNLRAIQRWAKEQNQKVELSGVDINPSCIEFATTQSLNKDIRFYCSNYRTLTIQEKPDIIFSSLFCHHFTDAELVIMLRWMKENSRVGFFINDLHRHPLAYYSIAAITKVFSKSYLVKNDAPLSVLRAFRRSDWNTLFGEAGIEPFNCQWKWAFRWLITYQQK